MKTDPFTYALYHLPQTTDLEAHLAYNKLYPHVRALAGVLWVAHNHGVLGPAFVVVALPTQTPAERRASVVGEAEVVATLTDADLLDHIDAALSYFAEIAEEPAEAEEEAHEQ